MVLSEADEFARLFSHISRAAGAAILGIYGSGARIRHKDDRSPVTDADEAAEAIILEHLARETPGIPVFAEESCARGARIEAAERFILVDPLDGTKEFIGGNGEFTVNIALIDGGAPVAGCVYAPAIDALYAGGTGAWREDAAGRSEIRGRDYPKGGLTAISSRSHPDAQSEAFLARLDVAQRMSAGSSLKFCRLAEGSADVYPRFGPTMEWDVAAGHAVLAAAGGTVVLPDGAPFTYGKVETGLRNTAFVAWGRAPLAVAG